MAERLDGTVALGPGRPAASAPRPRWNCQRWALRWRWSPAGSTASRNWPPRSAGKAARALVLPADITDEPTGARGRRADRRRTRPPGHAGQQRRRHAARAGRGRAADRVAADDQHQRSRPALLHPCGTSASCSMRCPRARGGWRTWLTSAPWRAAPYAAEARRTTRPVKYAVGAFSEALRQEVTTRYLRVSVVEPVRWTPNWPSTTG